VVETESSVVTVVTSKIAVAVVITTELTSKVLLEDSSTSLELRQPATKTKKRNKKHNTLTHYYTKQRLNPLNYRNTT
jgi:hypothetical protein